MSTLRETTEWQIHQNGEIIPEGDFETEAEAIAAMEELKRELGWTHLAVVQRSVLVPVSDE